MANSVAERPVSVFNSHSVTKPQVSNHFRFCTCEISEIKYVFGILSLAGIENSLKIVLSKI